MKALAVIRPQASVALGAAEAPLQAADVQWEYVEVYREVVWPDVSEVSGVIVLGGEMNVDRIDDYPFLSTAREFVARAVEREIPVLGVCLGAQLLARALGANVRTAPVKEIGFHTVRATATGAGDPVLGAFAPEMAVFQFHEDSFDLPRGADLLFRGEAVRNQAFRYGRVAYGVQFHFEVTREIIAEWCDETPNLRDGWGVTKQALLAEARALLPAQERACADTVTRWLELVRG